MNQTINTVYYQVKPIIPRYLQISARRLMARIKRPFFSHIWPIHEAAGVPPAGWQGWPEKKQFAFVLTHDVESHYGLDKCVPLMQAEKALGFLSLFNLVPEKYGATLNVRQALKRNGFEVGVHGLNHDGRLFKSRDIFLERVEHINQYLSEWGAAGFRAPAMHHNLEWLKELNIEYDLSTFDTDPFEPQSDGVSTIFPFVVPRTTIADGYVEMPYTLPQDHNLFVILKEKNGDTWKRKLDWIAEKGGLALINVHPDYLHFGENQPGLEEFPIDYYLELLEYVQAQYGGSYWHGLPCELARYIKKNMVVDLKC